MIDNAHPAGPCRGSSRSAAPPRMRVRRRPGAREPDRPTTIIAASARCRARGCPRWRRSRGSLGCPPPPGSTSTTCRCRRHCFPALTVVAGELRVADEAIRSLELPALRGVGSLDLDGDAQLQVVDAPWLRDVSELYVARDRALVALRFDMTGAESITLEELPALQLLQLGSIDQISRDLDIEHTGLADLRAFALVSKIGGDLTLHANAATPAIEEGVRRPHRDRRPALDRRVASPRLRRRRSTVTVGLVAGDARDDLACHRRRSRRPG